MLEWFYIIVYICVIALLKIPFMVFDRIKESYEDVCTIIFILLIFDYSFLKLLDKYVLYYLVVLSK